MKVGVIGVGVMGGGMARRLLSCGHEVSVYDRSSLALTPFAELGAHVAESPASAATDREYVVTSLPRDTDVRAAISGPGGVVAGLASGALVIDTSTVSPGTVLGLAEHVKRAGGAIVDAPVVTSQRPHSRPVPSGLGPRPSTGQQAAAAGNLGFFVGGDPAAVDRARPLLDVLGLECHHVGPLGAGALVKLVNNAIVGTQVAFLSELMVVARRAGLDLGRVVDILLSSSARSAVLETHIARFTVPDEFPQGQFPVEYMIKDLRLTLDAAMELGVSCEVVSAALGRFEQAAEQGLGGMYNAAVIRSIESRGTGTAAG
jgi:3-hydroxyisobutyrate dehydrogenase